MGRDGTQSFVYRVKINGELTHPCGAPVVVTSIIDSVLVDLD